MGRPVLLVLHLDGHDGAREVPRLAVLLGLGGQQVLGQRGVQRVRQQDKLELDLGGDGNGSEGSALPRLDE